MMIGADQDSSRALFEVAARQDLRTRRLTWMALGWLVGALIFGLAGFVAILGSMIGFVVCLAVSAGFLAAGVVALRRRSTQVGERVFSTREMIDHATSDCRAHDPLQETECLGAMEVLCSDESMVMLVSTSPFLIGVVVRVLAFLASIGIAALVVIMVVGGGTKVFLHLKGVVVYSIGAVILCFIALRRRPLRWYASKEEGVIRIESVRWIFARDIHDIEFDQIASVSLEHETVFIERKQGERVPLLEIEIPNLVGVNKESAAAAIAALRHLQYRRVRESLEKVMPGSTGRETELDQNVLRILAVGKPS